MARKQASSTARRMVRTVQAAMMLALAGVTGLSVSGQTQNVQREWRDYAGGPDSSRFIAAKQITTSNVNQLQVAWTYGPEDAWKTVGGANNWGEQSIDEKRTTLTAYDLNRGTIKWQIGLGDDLRLVGQGVTGTGTAASTKGGIIVTGTGLLFVTAADRKVHVYDSTSGKQLWELRLGGTTSGSPSMYELGGRQYLLVTASAAGGRDGGRGGADANLPAPAGPTGIVAYAPRN